MVCKTAIWLVALACLSYHSSADTNVAVPVNGHNVPVADVGQAQTGATSQPGDPSLSGPDQTFTASYDGVNAQVGTTNGVPDDSASVDPAGVEQAAAANSDVSKDLQPDGTILTGAGKRRQLLGNRKMLGDLDLSGSGVSAGDDTAGAAANAYGHGVVGSDDLLDPQDNHIEPHGVDGTVTTDGTATTGGVEVNPDCTGTVEGYNEGPDCVGVTGK